MRKRLLIFVTIVGLVLACSNDDVSAPQQPEPEQENQPPSAFSLLEVNNNAIGVDVLPTFSWETSTDPDGSLVTYNLILDTQTDAQTELAKGISDTVFTLAERLKLSTEYVWKVVANDGIDSVTSNLNTFFTRGLNIPDRPVTASPAFSERSGFTLTVYKDTLWLIGGQDSEFLNDIWFTTNGENWSQPVVNANFLPRRDHTTVVFDNKMWIIGGRVSKGENVFEPLNDVWFSDNGVNWNEATPHADFSPRQEHAAVVFENKLWIIGGLEVDENNQNVHYKSDVWASSDGVSWESVNPGAPFLGRRGHTVTVFKDALWLIAGDDGSIRNDIWSSKDGVLWEEMVANTSAPFGRRSGHSTVVFDNRIWTIGGFGAYDTWASKDGIDWSLEIAPQEILDQDDSVAVVFDNRLWLISYRNVIWSVD